MAEPVITIGEVRAVPGQPFNAACPHAPHVPPFDATLAEACSVEGVRARWPRFVGVCSACGQFCTLYASIEHCEAGGWFT